MYKADYAFKFALKNDVMRVLRVKSNEQEKRNNKLTLLNNDKIEINTKLRKFADV